MRHWYLSFLVQKEALFLYFTSATPSPSAILVYTLKMIRLSNNLWTKVLFKLCKFQEADNWTVLSSDVDKVFESRDIKAVSLDVNHKL